MTNRSHLSIASHLRSILALAVGLGMLSVAVAAADSSPDADASGVEAAVLSFNAAVSARDADAVASHFAAGAVLLTSKPAHADIGGSADLASDAVVQWKAVASLLKNATKSYSRVVDDLQIHVEGDLATVWCRTRTETHSLEGGDPTVLEFTETYTLFRREDGWKIAALANNRPTR